MTAQTLYGLGRDPGQRPHLLHSEGLALCGAPPKHGGRFLVIPFSRVTAAQAAAMGACSACLAKARQVA